MEEHKPAVNSNCVRGAELLRAYRENPNPDTRNQLIEHYFFLVVSAANRVAARVGRVVRAEELIAAGVFGLVDAIDDFDERKRTKFTTYSALRIRGAMLDELRAMDPAPRRIRSRARRLEAATRALESQLGRPPSDEELAAYLNLDPARLGTWKQDARLAGMASLSTIGCSNRDDGRGASAMPVDPDSADPPREAQRRMLREILLRGLSRAERLALMLYYYEDLTMREIGTVLDLSESRVSQMLTSVRARLRASIGHSRPQTPDELAA